jgi:hypothetical protein
MLSGSECGCGHPSGSPQGEGVWEWGCVWELGVGVCVGVGSESVCASVSVRVFGYR